MYPAGYGGNYVNWALSVSDLDVRKTCVLDPINKTNSIARGGPGTSHYHERIPTHQGYGYHVNWVMLNRPTEPKIYVINSDSKKITREIVELFSHDPEGIVICVHDNDDESIRSYGEINMVTKWPTFIAAHWASDSVEPLFDPFNIDHSNNIFRNWAVDNSDFFWYMSPIGNEDILRRIKERQAWYHVRNSTQPHEVNTNSYLVPKDSDVERVFQLSTLDIASDRLPDMVDHILRASGASDNHAIDHLKQFHHNYVDAQKNLQWFDSYKHWNQTGKLDDYLLSHGIVQAQIIRRILQRSNCIELTNQDRDQWISFYTRVRGPDWPELGDNEYSYYHLPAGVQREIQDFTYAFKTKGKPIKAILDLDWRNTGIEEINQIYQLNRID